MTYEYVCSKHGSFDVIKSASDRDRQERCSTCGDVASYKFVPTRNLNPGAAAMRGEFYHSFGKQMNSRRDIKNEISRIESETGKKIVEVGTEKPDSGKRVRKEYDVSEAVKHLRHELKHGAT